MSNRKKANHTASYDIESKKGETKTPKSKKANAKSANDEMGEYAICNKKVE